MSSIFAWWALGLSCTPPHHHLEHEGTLNSYLLALRIAPRIISLTGSPVFGQKLGLEDVTA